MAANTAFFFVKLRPGADRDKYERWLVERDYPTSNQLSSVLAYRSHRVEGTVKGAPPAHDYIEVVDITSPEDFLRDLEHSPDIDQIRTELSEFIEPNSCYWCRRIDWPGRD